MILAHITQIINILTHRKQIKFMSLVLTDYYIEITTLFARELQIDIIRLIIKFIPVITEEEIERDIQLDIEQDQTEHFQALNGELEVEYQQQHHIEHYLQINYFEDLLHSQNLCEGYNNCIYCSTELDL